MDRYVVISADSQDQFEKLVNEKIKVGYSPIGNLVILHLPEYGKFYYYQAVYFETTDSYSD